MKLLGKGGSREVYALGDAYVIKYPTRSGRRYPYNRWEALIWRHAPDELRQWLVPVIDCAPDGAWLIMPKGEPIADLERPAAVHSALHDWRKVANWVRLDGRVLLCDYAQPKTIKALKICLDD